MIDHLVDTLVCVRDNTIMVISNPFRATAIAVAGAPVLYYRFMQCRVCIVRLSISV